MGDKLQYIQLYFLLPRVHMQSKGQKIDHITVKHIPRAHWWA
jgi:hypothetical protein